jgi:hypothetical protein
VKAADDSGDLEEADESGVLSDGMHVLQKVSEVIAQIMLYSGRRSEDSKSMLGRLVRLALRRWRSQQQGVVKSLTKTEGGLNIAPKVRNHNLLINNNVICPDRGAMGRQGNIDNPVDEPERRRPFIENERGMRNVVNFDNGNLTGARIGVVCHDGSYRFWEWNSEKARFVEFVP